MLDGDRLLQELKEEAIIRREVLRLALILAWPEYELDWIYLHRWLIDRRN